LPFLRGLELRPLRSEGNSPASPLGLLGHSFIWRKWQRRYGTAVRNGSTETVTETDERERNAGNKALSVKYKLYLRRADGRTHCPSVSRWSLTLNNSPSVTQVTQKI